MILRIIYVNKLTGMAKTTHFPHIRAYYRVIIKHLSYSLKNLIFRQIESYI